MRVSDLARLALLHVALVLAIATRGHARRLNQASSVVDACSAYSLLGDSFSHGARLLSSATAADAAACCKLCSDWSGGGGASECREWTFCPPDAEQGCEAPVGPLVGASFEPGACLLSNPLTSDNATTARWSYRQPGVAWVAGRWSSGPSPEISESAAEATEDLEALSSRGNAFFCRAIASGTLQMRPLNGSEASTLKVALGQQVRYTGLTVSDEQGVDWELIYSNSSLWLYLAEDLTYCTQPQPGCTPRATGLRTEEGASCQEDGDCCAGMVCKPRSVGAVRLTWGADGSGGSAAAEADLQIGNTTQPYSLAPNECTRITGLPDADNATRRVSTKWVTTLDGPAACSKWVDGGWQQDDSALWATASPLNLPDAQSIAAYMAPLCANNATAGARLAEDLAKGGADARLAVAAGFMQDCIDGSSLGSLFAQHINPEGDATAQSQLQYANLWLAAAEGLGLNACATVAVLDAAQDPPKTIDQFFVHSPGDASRVATSPAGPGPGSTAEGVPASAPAPSAAARPTPAPVATPPAAVLPPYEGAARLQPAGAASGVLEVFHMGMWGPIAGLFTGMDAVVACRQLGFGEGRAQQLAPPPGTAIPVAEDLTCDWYESSLANCFAHPYHGDQDMPALVAGVDCGNRTDPVPDYQVRLTDTCTRGEVEAAMAGIWGAVCLADTGNATQTDTLARAAAQVVCRGQGLRVDRPVAYNTSRAAFEGLPIWVAGLRCEGTEDSISKCEHRYFPTNTNTCTRLWVQCVPEEAAPAAIAAMCSTAPNPVGRCQRTPVGCSDGFCHYNADPAGSACGEGGAVCDERGNCAQP